MPGTIAPATRVALAQPTKRTNYKQIFIFLVALLLAWGCLVPTMSAQNISSFNVTDPSGYNCTYNPTPQNPTPPLCNIGPGDTLTISAAAGSSFGTATGFVNTCDCPNATITTWGQYQIKATVNFVANNSSISVELAGGGTGNAFSYSALSPVISSVQVGSCSSNSTSIPPCDLYIGVGQVVTINGNYFGTSTAGTSGLQVSMCDCGNNATIDSWSNQQITVTAAQVEPNSNVTVGLVGLTGWSNSVPYLAVTMNALIPPGGATTGHDASLINTYVLNTNNPLVAGASFQVEWSAIDQGPSFGSSQYNWAYTDNLYTLAKNAGKQVNFIFWANADSASSVCSPDGQYGDTTAGNCALPLYVWTALGTTNWANCQDNSGAAQRIPNYLNSAFQTNYQNFMQKVIARYGNRTNYPNMGYIRFGLGHGGETIPVGDWNKTGDPCKTQFNAWGLTLQNISMWTNYLTSMLSYEGLLDSPVQLMVGITPMGVGNGVPDAVAAAAVPLRIGFGSQGLEESDVNNCTGSTADWCNLFNADTGDKVPLELQTVFQSCPTYPNGCTAQTLLTGSLATLLPFATANHANVFEIYYQDWLVAYDSTYPGYYPSYQAVLLNAANGQ